MKIAFDIDGVLADFSSAACEAIRELGINNLPGDYVHTIWNFDDVLAPGQWEEIVFPHMVSKENLWLSLPAFEDEVDSLREYIRDHGDTDVCFITARPPSLGASATIQTQLWLAELELGMLGSEVYVTGRKSSEEKLAIIQGEKIKFFLDDSPGNVRICQGLADHRAFLLDRPYNQAAVDLPRVYSVAEFLLEVEAASHVD